jgi:hypothetical protein
LRVVPFEKLGAHGERAPYYPFPVAVEKGLLEPHTKKPEPLGDSAGVEIMAGRIPNSHHAGLIPFGKDHIAAFDHTAAEFHGKELHIAPAEKQDVTDKGEVQAEGAIIFGTDEGRLKLAAFVVDIVKNPWLTYGLTRGRVLGNVAVFSANVLETPEYEIKEIDLNSGVVIAQPRLKYF